MPSAPPTIAVKDQSRLRTLRIAVDIGGTFTDVAILDEASGTLSLGKSATQPRAMVKGILAAIADTGADARRPSILIHGSTVVINAIVERRGARTALITTRGFRDVYEIGRINRPESFNLFFKKHEPLVSRHLRLELSERLNAAGEVLVPFDDGEAEALIRRVLELGVESVAVVFLHAYRNPAHEKRMQEILGRLAPQLFVSTSHEICNEYREFERTSTAVANAYVGPLVRSYLTDLERETATGGLQPQVLLMQSSGGLYDISAAKTQCLYMLESGPAAGVTGATALSQRCGIARAISFDMGGTTAKASVIENGLSRTAADYFVGGYVEGVRLRIPVVDIHEVGTGGGSIARVDESGMLTVGPQSAGAEPGPICYGQGGTEPTVTDANVALGRIDPNNFLGGRVRLDAAAAIEGIERKIAWPLGMSREEAAIGILRIATASMANAVRGVTTRRGLDPRDFTLISYGGAGPLHAAAVAQDLFIPRVIVPPAPSHFSAVGMLYADFRRDYARTYLKRLEASELAAVERVYQELETQGRAALRASETEFTQVIVQRAADMRYVGQEHTVTISVPLDLSSPEAFETVKRTFDETHELRYSHHATQEPVELVTLRSSVTGLVAKPTIRPIPRGKAKPPDRARRGSRKILFDAATGAQLAEVFRRDALLAGNVIVGPALIEEPASVTLVYPGDRVEVHELGHLTMEVSVR
jgi:N-methylhydantoinase A